ncbi:phosphotransferase [Paraphotobacterium marinum]|uniref:phosphotransferase n=1 Tax=Paraphotobacterium marinum TaxID=1755811 RepID=UPI001CEF7FAF
MFKPTLCHNDLHPGNLFKVKNQFKVIDWEYAYIYDPSYDLAMMIYLNQMDIDDAVSQYCSINFQINEKKWKKAIIYWTPYCKFICKLWEKLK